MDFSKDWSDECDVPCVWSGNSDKAEGVFYIIKIIKMQNGLLRIRK